MSIISSTLNKSRIKRLLMELKFSFDEDTSRMNYGHIGNLMSKDGIRIRVVIFPKSFYVHDKDISINTKMLEVIQLIQLELKELSFKKFKPQLLFPKNA